jgi:hypothetical protein
MKVKKIGVIQPEIFELTLEQARFRAGFNCSKIKKGPGGTPGPFEITKYYQVNDKSLRVMLKLAVLAVVRDP